MSLEFPTLERATQQARDEARRTGAPVYVIEMENEARLDAPDIPAPAPLDRLALLAELEAERRPADLTSIEGLGWLAEQERRVASGELPAWDAMSPPPGEDARLADLPDPHDPIVFGTVAVTIAAIMVRDHGTIELLRVARPDGRVEAVADPDGECARLLVQYAGYLRAHPPLPL